MELRGRSIVLLGRFSAGVRERFRRRIEDAGGAVTRDLTRRSGAVVVGGWATSLIKGDVLSSRLGAAEERGLPIYGERGFASLQDGAAREPAPYPLDPLLAQTGLTLRDLRVLAAFDLVILAQTGCRLSDAATIRAAADLMWEKGSLEAAVKILVRARALAPRGRHKLVLTSSGEAALQWHDGLTTLEGQGYLPLDLDLASVDELFDAAVLAQAEGDLREAARLFDLCGRADSRDAVAFYNLANIRLEAEELEAAVLAYQRSLSRDPGFAEARYNLAQALEALGRSDAAASELVRLLAVDPLHGDALFNLAQLRLSDGRTGDAKALYERYLALAPPDAWALKARRALRLCTDAPQRDL